LFRTQHGFTQAELGDRSGLHRTFIGAVERGEVNVSIDNVDRIAQALRVEPATLLSS